MKRNMLLVFNPPPGWPKPPAGWQPPKGWLPDPAWPPAPVDWKLWVEVDGGEDPTARVVSEPPAVSQSPSEPSENLLGKASQRIALLEAENAALRAQVEAFGRSVDEAVELDDARVLQNVGIYRYHHPLENAPAYSDRLVALEKKITEKIKSDSAIKLSSKFTLDGSLAKGRAMTGDLAKLMLRAYNAEAENVVRSLRAGNSVTAIKRLASAKAAIAKLGKLMEMEINETYHALRIEEIELTADYWMKREEEREQARADRERLREERRAEQELAAARAKLEKERSHLLTVLQKVQSEGGNDQTLQAKLVEIDRAIEENDYRTANIRAGYVYIISNRGAFGDHVVKIGLTRRLEPLDRVFELGDASVPFRFDVHAIFFSEDAVKLESELHNHFSNRRVNWANSRKEFFFASPAEVREVLREKVGNLLEFNLHVESSEYLQSVQYWPDYVHSRVSSVTVITE